MNINGGMYILLLLACWILWLILFLLTTPKSSTPIPQQNIVEIYGPRDDVISMLAEVLGRNRSEIKWQDYNQIMDVDTDQYHPILGWEVWKKVQFKAFTPEKSHDLYLCFCNMMGYANIRSEIKEL